MTEMRTWYAWRAKLSTFRPYVGGENVQQFLEVFDREDRPDCAPGGDHGLSGESYRAPETWAGRAYRNLIYFHEVDTGGHFAAWEQPVVLRRAARGVQILATAGNQ